MKKIRILKLSEDYQGRLSEGMEYKAELSQDNTFTIHFNTGGILRAEAEKAAYCGIQDWEWVEEDTTEQDAANWRKLKALADCEYYTGSVAGKSIDLVAGDYAHLVDAVLDGHKLSHEIGGRCMLSCFLDGHPDEYRIVHKNQAEIDELEAKLAAHEAEVAEIKAKLEGLK